MPGETKRGGARAEPWSNHDAQTFSTAGRAVDPGRRCVRRARRDDFTHQGHAASLCGRAGELPAAAAARLEAVAGVSLAIAGKTRTGGLEFTLAQPLEADAAKALSGACATIAACSGPETISSDASTNAKLLAVDPDALPGNKLMVRLAAAASPNWSALLPRWTSLIGSSVSRRSSDRGRLGPEAGGTRARCDPLEHGVTARDRCRRAVRGSRAPVHAQRVPNDPSFSQQWSLSDPVGGINVATAWDLQIGNSQQTVAVIDTGVTPPSRARRQDFARL